MEHTLQVSYCLLQHIPKPPAVMSVTHSLVFQTLLGYASHKLSPGTQR